MQKWFGFESLREECTEIAFMTLGNPDNIVWGQELALTHVKSTLVENEVRTSRISVLIA